MRRILVVDDHADIRESFELLFLVEGFEVAGAADGAEALDKIAAERPDLVVTDLLMPRLDGLAMSCALRADPATRDLPIVLVSAFVRDDETRAASVDVVLTKPVDVAVLLAHVRHLIEREARCARAA